MILSNESIKSMLTTQFGEIITGWEEPYGMLTFTVHRDQNLKLLNYLYDTPELAFRFLTDLTGIHYPDRTGEEFCVVYHLHNLTEHVRIRMKIYTPVERPDVYTATGLFSGANWMERETYDFYGINFSGHPQLKRILNMDEMVSFPMRKEFPMEDSGRTDKDDRFFGRTSTNI